MMLAAATLGLGSCTFLETDSPSVFSPEVVYSDPSMVEKVLLGVYAQMVIDDTYSQDLGITLNCGSDIEIRSFDNKKPDSSTDRAAANYLATASNKQVTRATKALYTAIERACVLIDGIEKSSPLYAAGDRDVCSMHGEAIVLRAQCYRDLIRLLGDVPFKMEPTKDDLSNAFLPKTGRFAIMERLIEDLQKYADEIPWKQDLGPERLTRGYAYGLLAQLALMRAGWNYTTDCEWVAPLDDAAEYYRIARDAALKVIESGEYSLTKASVIDGKQASGFKTFFYQMCQRVSLPEESLFELGFVMARSSEFGYTVGPRMYTANTTYGYSSQGQIFTTPEYFYSFHPDDTRRDVSVYYVEYRDISDLGVYPNGVTSTTGISENIIGNVQQFRVGKWDPTWMLPDFAAASYQAGGKIGTGVNCVMMRYSDILLMFAEADCMLKGTASPEAKDALWEVRSRAIPTLTRAEFDNYLAGKDFMKAVKDERRWEFIGEARRKWDLLRWGELPKAIIDMRQKNVQLYSEWRYEFEFPTRRLADGTVVDRALPEEVYYKYDENNERIVDINIDYALDKVPGPGYKIASEGKNWIYQSRDSKTSGATVYAEWLSYFASGLVDKDGNLVENGRPFYPVPSEMIDNYKGIIGQDYGY